MQALSQSRLLELRHIKNIRLQAVVPEATAPRLQGLCVGAARGE